LTVNLGMRYELNTVLRESNNRLGNFDPALGLVQVGKGMNDPYNGDHNNFAPRLGFAWDIRGDGKTVIRAGGSMVYEQLPFVAFLGIGNQIGLNIVPTGAQICVVNVCNPGPGNIAAVAVTVPQAQVNWNGSAVGGATVFPSSALQIKCGDGIGADGNPCVVPAVDRNLRKVFWEIIRRYPMLHWIQEEDVLDFRAYRDVQFISDTYVSPDRYIIVGDASSIIDAYYSQGISLSLSTSWHCANIAERDLREGVLDTAYIGHVNNAVLADWRIMRSVVKFKYGPAIADSRFFILDHWIDYLVFGAVTGGRWGIARWLCRTDGYTSNETPDLADLRVRLSRRLFLSQSPPFNLFHPARVASFFERLHEGAARRAIWRLDHGVSLPATTGAMRADAPLPALWRLPFLRFRRRADLTMKAIREPSFIHLKVSSKPPAVTKAAGVFLLVVTGWALGYDIVDTAMRRAFHGARGLIYPATRRGGNGGKGGSAEDVARETTRTEPPLSQAS